MNKLDLNIISIFLAMIVIVSSSNYMVQFPINNWLTWGALIYPISFFITELTNRFYGPQIARRVVYAGFTCAVALSIWLATPRIAFASGTAFLLSQLLDIAVFNRLRQSSWWLAPLVSSVYASALDTLLFWSLAFWGDQVPFLSLAVGDFLVKCVLDVVMLTPFRIVIRKNPSYKSLYSNNFKNRHSGT
jgi:uncharacterized PurR-regulated membrane protein YhhQ (DUF165 family)